MKIVIIAQHPHPAMSSTVVWDGKTWTDFTISNLPYFKTYDTYTQADMEIATMPKLFHPRAISLRLATEGP